MKILFVHNYYQLSWGEDRVLSMEKELVASKGHRFFSYTVDNNQIEQMGRMKLAVDTVWNRESYHLFREVIRSEHPDVVHFHNTFPLISPSSLDAARAEGIPVVQTLHNFRLICANALFLRDGKVCTLCLDRKNPLYGAWLGCYRHSRSASFVVASMLILHRARRTWRTRVQRYIALSEFARRTFVAGGLPAEKICIKPNFIDPDPGMGLGNGNFALYVGRLTAEKGVKVLLEAWQKLRLPITLKIIGEGPESARVEEARKYVSSIEWLGKRSNIEAIELIKQARVLIIPSICFENFPMTLCEAFATGTPVIASDLGSLHSLINHRQTGLLFKPGDSTDLLNQVEWAFLYEKEWKEMSLGARAEYEAKYSAERNYEQLMRIYQQAIAEKQAFN
jgi:glycosyltransferase involved in cell wall biosynthesis